MGVSSFVEPMTALEHTHTHPSVVFTIVTAADEEIMTKSGRSNQSPGADSGHMNGEHVTYAGIRTHGQSSNRRFVLVATKQINIIVVVVIVGGCDISYDDDDGRHLRVGKYKQ